MKKSLITIAIVLLAVAAQAQNTAIKVHSDGQLSLQSGTTTYGIQIPTNGVMSIEPNVTTLYGLNVQTKTFNNLVKSWNVRPSGLSAYPFPYTFYVLGNGSVYAYGGYYAITLPNAKSNRDMYPIEDAMEKVLLMEGHYMDSDEFGGITAEELENCEGIAPEALDGILKDFGRSKTIGLDAGTLEEILPEAVRHDTEGNIGINYNAVVAVLVEAFKEQQARISELEAILQENGLMRK